jgi:4-aminobutyrate aminotransferase-like enzyme/Ser/Thr protein kinase RdoA (MazF antagonist)
MNTDYTTLKIDAEQAAEIAQKLFNIDGEITTLPGEVDFNFKVACPEGDYLLKISRPDEDASFIEYQQSLINHLSEKSGIESPKIVRDVNGNATGQFTDKNGNTRLARMLSWMEGRLWSSVNPINNSLLISLGEQAAQFTSALTDFDHAKAHEYLEWDVAQASWTKGYLHLFEKNQEEILRFFLSHFEQIQPTYAELRKSVIHGDVNDNNILVSNDLTQQQVTGIIDYGDAIYTQTINDLAVALAYAAMHKPDPLNAASQVIKGYNHHFPLEEKEIDCLYTLIAMRLLITVTKSALNKQEEPENIYHQISEKPAWDLLNKWKNIHPNFAKAAFRKACGFTPQSNETEVCEWFEQQSVSLKDLFPQLNLSTVHNVDMSVSSTWLGHEFEYSDLELTAFKIEQLRRKNPNTLIAGGYQEVRPFYSTDAYKIEGNNGPEYRTVHLGVDFWVNANTPIHTLFDAKVYSVFNNDNNKDYGPTIILEHTTNSGTPFWTLHGHLSASSLSTVSEGQELKKGDLIGYVGDQHENGNWVPHLHFQIMLDMLGNKVDFPGVCAYKDIAVWSSICPDPNLLFKSDGLKSTPKEDEHEVLEYRKAHLGKSLSLSYDAPLKMLRGSGAYLIDNTGRKYLDTVNNVAHVGHEHPKVVQAGREQMALLNTNSRYLHENINAFAQELLDTFPKELSVVHFVNSGSEANELALRMAKAVTNQKDIIAVEIGYHGNTNACIEISSYKFDGKGGSGAPEHTHIVPLPDAYRGMYTGVDPGSKYAKHIGDQLQSIQEKNRNVAAFICESIISCGGQIELPEDYLKLAYSQVREAGGVCISDEVQVGCGRLGSVYWGFQLHDVVPDIVTIGKPLGNGHPLAAVVCTQKVAEAFANGMEYFNTFGGNPVSCAIGKTVLQVVREEGLKENALSTGNYLKDQLSKLQKEFPIIGDVRGQGLFLGFELVDQDLSPQGDKATYLANRMKELGILMSTDGKDNNVLKIKPPLVFSKENADELLRRLETVLSEDFMRL